MAVIIIPPSDQGKPAGNPACLLQYKTAYGWECLRTQSEVDAYKAQIDKAEKDVNEFAVNAFRIIFFSIVSVLIFTALVGKIYEMTWEKERRKIYGIDK